MSDANGPMERLRAICATMTKASQEFQRCLNELRETHAREIDRIQRERDALLAARVNADIDDPNNINQIPGVEIATTKKVRRLQKWFYFLISLTKYSFFVFSAQTAIEKQWPNAHCVEEHHIVRHFANAKIGMLIKLSALAIQMKEHNKSCCWSMNKRNICEKKNENYDSIEISETKWIWFFFFLLF